MEKDSDDHKIQKRPTVLLNRLVYALQNAIQPDEVVNRQHQELERRGYPKHYWKCYFNAVSCFKRKRQPISYSLMESQSYGPVECFTCSEIFRLHSYYRNGSFQCVFPCEVSNEIPSVQKPKSLFAR
ncbi:uncharacterized protein CEXT_425481 [Caerostris extrusa]|uniref:Uncharacterized protein n=1 Tax=Caerostris extrusa TaxID=172846 RepID=A0AAV4PQE1_CAEEX|nr:uncharacterized protein CEXT_425481 [Caerostris extrusa]